MYVGVTGLEFTEYPSDILNKLHAKVLLDDTLTHAGSC